eukprot:SAG11_NODE_1247_length_5401_cov_2.372878_3_plen_69_part_00
MRQLIPIADLPATMHCDACGAIALQVFSRRRRIMFVSDCASILCLNGDLRSSRAPFASSSRVQQQRAT